MRRAGAATVIGVTAALLVGLVSTSIADELPARIANAVRLMGLSLAGLIGMGTAVATLLVSGGRRRAGLSLYATVSLASIGFVTWAAARIPERPSLVLAASDRVEQLREFHDGDVRGIEHPTLGFRLPSPTLALTPSTEVADETRTIAAPGWEEAHAMWTFETADHGVVVTIDLSRAEHADEAALRELDRAVTGPLEAAGHAVSREPIAGEPGCLRERIEVRPSFGGRANGALYVFEDGARALALRVTVVSDGTGDWRTWIDDVSLACERESS